MGQEVQRLDIGELSFPGRYWGTENKIKSPYQRVLQSLLRHAVNDFTCGNYKLSLFLEVGGSLEQESIQTGVGRSIHYQNSKIVGVTVNIGKDMFELSDREFMKAYSDALFAGLLRVEKYLERKKLQSNILQIQEIAIDVIESYLNLSTPFEISEDELKTLAVLQGQVKPTEVLRAELFDGKVGSKTYKKALKLLRQLGTNE
ncbi:MAG: hypothetical protein KF836_13655 [Fimbriimonadaceae bacterium]|nr:hypothetical protein [Fimbriimonadaceae bacterium]